MIVACRTKNSGEHWGSEAPAVAALFGMDYLQFRFVGGPNAIGARRLRDDPLRLGQYAMITRCRDPRGSRASRV